MNQGLMAKENCGAELMGRETKLWFYQTNQQLKEKFVSMFQALTLATILSINDNIIICFLRHLVARKLIKEPDGSFDMNSSKIKLSSRQN